MAFNHISGRTTALSSSLMPSETVSKQLRQRPTYIEPGSLWENGYCKSFNGRMKDELLNGEIFYSLREAQIIIERWRNHYNTKRPHSALGYHPPAPEAGHPDGPKASQALTFKLDHSSGAAQLHLIASTKPIILNNIRPKSTHFGQNDGEINTSF